FEKNKSHNVERAETREMSKPGLVCRLLRSRGRIGVAECYLVVKFDRFEKGFHQKVFFDLFVQGFSVRVLLSSRILSTSLLLGFQVSETDLLDFLAFRFVNDKVAAHGYRHVKKARILDQCAVSIKEDTAYLCLHSPKTTKGMKINMPMDDPNLTMEEYIRLEEEKAHKHEKVFNWQTATYGKIRVDDDLHNLSSVEAEFPAIVINDAVAPQDELQCKSQVSTPVNDEIDFRISFDESDDEDYTILFDKNLFSYQMISVNYLKKDSENDYEKFMPSIPSPKPAISYFDDLDFFKDFENKFPAIVYNDAQTSKLDLLTEPILNPQHIDEFNLKDKTSLSECDEEEQNILNFNDLFPFNVIYPDELKMVTDNDNDKIDIEHSSGDLSVKLLPDVITTDVGAYANRTFGKLSTKLVKVSTSLKCWSLETSRRLFNTKSCS
ncbi:hypothetical protein Tco_0768454, partial [Tanacetum coccineum]